MGRVLFQSDGRELKGCPPFVWTFYDDGTVIILTDYEKIERMAWKVVDGKVKGMEPFSFWVPFGEPIQEAYRRYVAQLVIA